MSDILVTKLQNILDDKTANLKPENLKKGVTALGVEGQLPEVNNQDITVTQNGIYNADEGYTGLGQVTVNVADTPELVGIDITQNGEYLPEEGVDGFNRVNVQVDLSLEELNATENGEYLPEETNGFNKVTVAVQPKLEEKTVTDNGIYTPSEGKEGFSKFTVNVDKGTDTSSANATENDLIENKTAYVQGKKIIGKIYDLTHNTGETDIIPTGLASKSSYSEFQYSENRYKFTGVMAYETLGRKYCIGQNSHLGMDIEESFLANTIGLTPDKLVKGETVCGVIGSAETSSDIEELTNNKYPWINIDENFADLPVNEKMIINPIYIYKDNTETTLSKKNITIDVAKIPFNWLNETLQSTINSSTVLTTDPNRWNLVVITSSGNVVFMQTNTQPVLLPYSNSNEDNPGESTMRHATNLRVTGKIYYVVIGKVENYTNLSDMMKIGTATTISNTSSLDVSGPYLFISNRPIGNADYFTWLDAYKLNYIYPTNDELTMKNLNETMNTNDPYEGKGGTDIEISDTMDTILRGLLYSYDTSGLNIQLTSSEIIGKKQVLTQDWTISKLELTPTELTLSSYIEMQIDMYASFSNSMAGASPYIYASLYNSLGEKLITLSDNRNISRGQQNYYMSMKITDNISVNLREAYYVQFALGTDTTPETYKGGN